MKSAYEKITTYQGEHFEDYLKDQGLFTPFWDIFARYKAIEVPEKIVRYIAHCYSVESEFTLRGGTWAAVKDNVARLVELPEQYYDQVVYLGQHQQWDQKVEGWEDKKKIFEDEISAVVRGIQEFMTLENDRDNRHLKVLYDLYEEQMAGMSDPHNSYDEKDKCRKRAGETKVEMEKIEQGIKNKRNAALNEGLREVGRLPSSLRPEIAARK